MVVLRPVLPPPSQPFFQHGDAVHAMIPGQVVGAGQSMSAAANDDDVVVMSRLRIAPGSTPVGMTSQRMTDQAEDRIFGHSHIYLDTGPGGVSGSYRAQEPRRQNRSARYRRHLLRAISEFACRCATGGNQVNRAGRGNPVGGCRPLPPRLPCQGVRLVSVRCRPPFMRQDRPSVARNTLISARLLPLQR